MKPAYAGRNLAKSNRRIRRSISFCIVLVTIYLITAIISCGTKSDPADHPLTQDEQYLVDTYIKIIQARDLHSQYPARAESIFTAIDSTTDTLRIANTITRINETPRRWEHIFEVLDTRLQQLSKQSAGRESPSTR